MVEVERESSPTVTRVSKHAVSLRQRAAMFLSFYLDATLLAANHHPFGSRKRPFPGTAARRGLFPRVGETCTASCRQ